MKAYYRVFGALALLLASVIFAQLASANPLPNAWQISDFSSAAGDRLGYTNYLSSSQQAKATNSGFVFSVRARFVSDLGSPTMAMAYGLGGRRFLILFDLNASRDLTASLEGAGTYTVTANGTGTNFYHTHTIQFNPTSGKAAYSVDGNVLTTNWTSSTTPLAAGQVFWGAGSSDGQAVMNFHNVTFEIFGLGVVSAYDGGTAGNPDPAAQGWTNDPFPPPQSTGTLSVAPDDALFPLATTLPADQFTTDTARLNGLVNPAGSPAQAWFEWGTSTNYGNSTTPQSVGSGTSATNPATVISGLVNGADYHFRSAISNMFGTAVGADQSFTQPGFVPITISNLLGVVASSVAWGDYDNDGRLDFLITGTTNGPSDGVSQLWRNTGVGFSNVTASVAPSLPRVYAGSVAWGDYDNDGRLDFLITGGTNASSSSAISQLWRNTGFGFSNVTASVAPDLPRFYFGSVAWGDYDNDGRLGFLISGHFYNGTDNYVSQLWRNTGVGFSNVTASIAPGLPGVVDHSLAWGDYDKDGRLDFLIKGTDGTDNYVSQLWRNNLPLSNAPPPRPRVCQRQPVAQQ